MALPAPYQAIAAAEGMSEDLFEKVIIEMMARGVPANATGWSRWRPDCVERSGNGER